MARIRERIASEPAVIIVSLVAIAEVLNAQVGLPAWVHVISACIIAVAGALGLRSRVTPYRK